MRRDVMRSLHYVIFSLLFLLPQPVLALQWTAETSQAIDGVFAEYDRTSGPGCAVGVAEAGRLVFARGYGIGQMDHRIPLGGESVFYLASVSKQFAAAAIVIAEHEGHLSMDDPVSAHIPEFPTYAQGAVTIRHLVHHTSGVRDYLTLMRLAGTPYENILSDEDMLGLITRQRELNFVPGTEHLYSNSGYVLMAEIVKRATGRSLRAYADEKIFRPLGMSNTHFHDDRLQVVPGRVFSYDPPAAGAGRTDADGRGRTGGGWRAGHGWRTSYLIDFDKVGDGGLYSSVADLAKWDRAFYEDVLGVPGFAERMYRRGVLAGGDTIAYARGLSVGERRGLARVSHGGGFMAFRTMIARYPEQRTTVITLCNVGTANPGALSTAVEDIVLASAFTEPPEERVAPTSPAGAPGAADEPAFAVSEAAVQALAGTYHSRELDATWRLEADGTQLLLHHPRGDTETLTARREDVFGSGGIEFAFEHDDGRAVAFLLAAGRVRNLRFERTDHP
ncbi:MAG: beta-lactamase family protein [Gemmatimonadetes bacterium]|nr:beta-lactamase family protein [Gemmatimonadota bacterium]MYE93833.1 beta-lactamase family protein [Gemmatimonadota bacterium]MYJ12544.1 beta-lactamase family protein [Gemmatimonadota bacterium]